MSNWHGHTKGYPIILLLFLDARWSFFLHSTSFSLWFVSFGTVFGDFEMEQMSMDGWVLGGVYVHVESGCLVVCGNWEKKKHDSGCDHKVKVCHASKISEWHNRTKFKNILLINASVVVCDHETQKRYIILYFAMGWCHMHVYVLHLHMTMRQARMDRDGKNLFFVVRLGSYSGLD